LRAFADDHDAREEYGSARAENGANVMRRSEICLTAFVALIAATQPGAAQQQPAPRPCAALRQVCVQAGFVPQGARAGEGLIVDCIRPLMQGIPQPQRATKPLPAVDPALIEACRAQNPNFGMGNAAQQRPPQAPSAMQPPPAMQGPPPQNEPAEPPQAPPPAPR
jgi:hypothetical protein